MVLFLYGEINVICIVLCAILLRRLYRDVAVKREVKLFRMEIWYAILLFVLDTVWTIAETAAFPGARVLNLLVNTAYMIETGIAGYGWFIYNEYSLNPEFDMNRKKKMLGMIPVILLTTFLLVNIGTKWIFYIDDKNQYHRGMLYMLQPVLAYGYVVVATIRAWMKYKDEKNYVMKKMYGTLMFFAFYPSIGMILQIFFFGAPFICVGITLSLINIFLNMQEALISLDPLTQLNNRNQLSRFLMDFNREDQRNKETYFMLMDIDHFKQINDTYGHPEGDLALQRVADVLRKTCSAKNCFLARYGGDEFVVVYQADHSSEMEDLKARIHAELKIANKEANTPYQIEMSIGSTKFTEDMRAAQEGIEMADAELYKIKMLRKQQK